MSPLSIDINSIWDDYTGKSIKVGVIDSQIDYRHADLARAYDLSLDYNFAKGTASPTIDAASMPYFHGTAVAGVIAAQAGNGVGTAGIAHGATLVGLGIDYNAGTVVSDILKAFDASASLDVVNNSWSYVTNFADNFTSNPEYLATLKHVAADGRGGLGTSIVFAAGNAGTGGSSNYHNFQNSPYAIAVGAVNPDGSASSFTSIGANVLISAAGKDVVTTTLNNRYDYFDGTSFAAPAVTGAIALMLEANPNLGYRDVQEILAYSAQRSGLADNGAWGDGWRTNGADNYNGGGLHFSDSFGYGFLNVHDAVRLAETWTQQQTLANMGTLTQSVALTQNLVAGSNDHVSFGIPVTGAMDIEHVQLALNISWLNTGDLDIYLTSPDGTQVRLVYDMANQNRLGDISNFTFSSVASMGEEATGTWTVDVYNRDPAAVDKKGVPLAGKVKGATLTLTGNAGSNDNDTYVYTDEFASLYQGADLAARSKLVDKSGTDTINAAAVTSNTVIDLTGAMQTKIAGIILALAANTIENVYTGDGNDVLVGSTVNNVLNAGRGDDVLYFSFGNDFLDGGSGSDTLKFSGSFASYGGSLDSAGNLQLSLGANGITTLKNVEVFSFADVTYSFNDVVAHLAPPAQNAGGSGSNGGTGQAGGGTDAGTETGSGTGSGAGGGAGSDGGTGTPGSGAGDAPASGKEVFDEASHTFAKFIDGGAGAERLLGSQGADLIHGLAGDDKLLGNAGDDFIDGGAGLDKLNGGDGNDILVGGAGDDTLTGDKGDDWIRGGLGKDMLYGGAGADTFVFDSTAAGDLDTIYDFNFAEGDRIVVSGVSANADASFQFVTVGNVVYLEMDDASGSHYLAKIKGPDVGNLDTHSASSMLLWA